MKLCSIGKTCGRKPNNVKRLRNKDEITSDPDDDDDDDDDDDHDDD